MWFSQPQNHILVNNSRFPDVFLQLSNSFKTWKERFERNVRNLEILEEHLQKKEAELLNRCLVKWMKFMLRCKAEKSHQKKLLAKVKLLKLLFDYSQYL